MGMIFVWADERADVLALLLSVAGLVFAMQQVLAAGRDRRERQRPYVSAAAVMVDGRLGVVVKNYGMTEATQVRLRLDVPLESASSEHLGWQEWAFPTLAPGESHLRLYDLTTLRYMARAEDEKRFPMSVCGTLVFVDASRNRHKAEASLPVVLDWSVIAVGMKHGPTSDDWMRQARDTAKGISSISEDLKGLRELVALAVRGRRCKDCGDRLADDAQERSYGGGLWFGFVCDRCASSADALVTASGIPADGPPPSASPKRSAWPAAIVNRMRAAWRSRFIFRRRWTP